ncbi:MAG: L-threonylcarbamoyladenylate synthase [Spirochaetes bacterium]|nr:L-threonylcarbamoyladenylate synthase [Spirochaetota bacterium]
MEMLGSGEADLRRAGEALAAGRLVVIPTETVYGLGADAFNPGAVARVFEAKARPSFDPLIVHIASFDSIEKVARTVPLLARRLAEALWPGPLTLVLPKCPELPDIVSSGLDTVAIRFPSHPLARKIIEYSGTAIAAPSANPFGYISPTTAAHVARSLGDKVDFIVDGGPCAVGVESTVLDVSGEGLPTLLRPGGMPLERIREIAGEVLLPKMRGGPVASPGQLKSHYAPHTKLFLYDWMTSPDSIRIDKSARSAVIVFDALRSRAFKEVSLFDRVCVLSGRGDMREAAFRLFALLHELDAEGFDAIYAERVPEEGLGRAINDRLWRASRK